MNLRDFAAWECDSLEALVALGHPHLSSPGLSSRIDARDDPDGRLTQFHVVAGASQMLLECAVQHMNSLVDSYLLMLANASLSEATARELVDGQKRTRQKLECEVAAVIDKDLSSFEGWDSVQRVRRDANAIKHRAGVTMELKSGGQEVHASSVDLSRTEVLELLAGVRSWLLEVVGAVQQAHRADAAR